MIKNIIVTKAVILKILLVIFLVGLIFKACTANAGEIGISTGASNLVYYKVGQDIRNACTDLNINIYESKGGISNIGNLFTKNNVQYGIVPYDTLRFKEITDAAKMSKIKTLMPLYKNVIQVIASDRSGIKTIGDLRGKRVNVGPIGSGSWVSAQLISIRTGIKFTVSTYSTAESLKKVISGDLDAAFYFSGLPTPDLVALGKDGEGIIHLVNMSHPSLENFYEATTVPEDTYAWEHKAVQALQIQNYLVVYNYTSAEKQADAEALLSCIVSKLDWLAENGNPVWRAVDHTAEVKWPLHPVAERILHGR